MSKLIAYSLYSNYALNMQSFRLLRKLFQFNHYFDVYYKLNWQSCVPTYLIEKKKNDIILKLYHYILAFIKLVRSYRSNIGPDPRRPMYVLNWI